MMDVAISTILCNILVICLSLMMLAWGFVGVETVIRDFKREDREKKKFQYDAEYHLKRMEDFDK